MEVVWFSIFILCSHHIKIMVEAQKIELIAQNDSIYAKKSGGYGENKYCMNEFIFDYMHVCPEKFKLMVQNGENVCVYIKIGKQDDRYIERSINLNPLNFSTLVDQNNKNLRGLFWTDYKRAYDGGIFFNWNHERQTMGKPLLLDIVNGLSENNSSFRCLAIDVETQNFTVKSCTDELPRLYVIRAIIRYAPFRNWSCKRIKYSNSLESCLTFINENKLFVSNDDEKRKCQILSKQGLNAKITLEDGVYCYVNKESRSILLTRNVSADAGLFRGYRMTDKVKCELLVKKTEMPLEIWRNSNGISVSVENRSAVSIHDIICFTDSMEFHPTNVGLKISNSSTFEVETDGCGDYWCVTDNGDKYIETNKLSFVKSEYNWLNTYDIQFEFEKPSDVFDIKQHYLEKFKNSSFFKSYLMETNSNAYRLKHIYTNSSVVFRIDISKSVMDRIKISESDLGEIVKIESLLCQQILRETIAADNSSVIKDGNRFLFCKYSGDFGLCRPFECHNESKNNCYEFVRNPNTFKETVEYIFNKDDITKDDVQLLVDELNGVEKRPKIFILEVDNTILNKVNVSEGGIHASAQNLVVGVTGIGFEGPDPIVGVMLSKNQTTDVNNDFISFLNNEQLIKTIENPSDAEIIVELHNLNKETISNNLAVVVFHNERLFQTNELEMDRRIENRIIGIPINLSNPLVEGQYVDIHFRSSIKDSIPKVCINWDTNLEDWSTEGCEMIKKIDNFYSCRCYYLTYYSLTNSNEHVKIIETGPEIIIAESNNSLLANRTGFYETNDYCMSYYNFEYTYVCPDKFKLMVHNGVNVCVDIKIGKQEDRYTESSIHLNPLNFSTLVDQNNKNLRGLFWTDYKRANDGGVYFNWNHDRQTMGKPLLLDIVNGLSKDNSSFRCLAIDVETQNFTVKSCTDELPRLYVIRAIVRYAHFRNWSCKQIDYKSSLESCLTFRNVNKLFVSNDDEKRKCQRLNRQGLNAKITLEDGVYCYVNKESQSFIFMRNESADAGLFHEYQMTDKVMCDRAKKVEMTIQRVSKGIYISVESNTSVSVQDIMCFTDSVDFYPTNVGLMTTLKSSTFELETEGCGDYWCVTSNTEKFQYNETTKLSFVKSEYNWLNTYDIQFEFEKSSDAFDIKQHYLEKFENSSFFKSYLMETNSNAYRLKHVYTNSSVVFRVDVSKSVMNKILRSKSDLGEIVKIESLLCQQNLRKIIAADNSSVSREGNRTLFCTTFGESICRHFECHNKSNFLFYEFVKIYETLNETLEYIMSKDDIIKDDIQLLVDKLNSVQKKPEKVKVLEDVDIILNSVNVLDEEIHISAHNLVVGIISIGSDGLDSVVGAMLSKNRAIDMTSSGISFLNEEKLNETLENPEVAEIIVELHEFNKENLTSNLAIVVWHNEILFQTKNGKMANEMKSKIIGISTNLTNPFVEGEFVIIHFRSFDDSLSPATCVFWDTKLENWSTEGCEMIKSKSDDFRSCRCNHLTYFALINPTVSAEEIYNHRLPLKIISYCGCTASLIGLFLIVLTAILFKQWRAEFSNKVYLNLSITIAFLMITFMTSDILESRLDKLNCTILGALLHYSLLANFCWMLIVAVFAYKKLVKVFNDGSSHRLLKACICGWIIPLMPVVILLCVDHTNYSRLDSVEQGILFCYPSGQGFWFAVFLPVVLIVGVNFVLFCFIFYKVFGKSAMTRRNDSREVHRTISISLLLFFLFGLTWIFGLLSKYLIFNYLFCITSTTQGIVLCVFFVFANDKTRGMWTRKIKCNFKNENNSNSITEFTELADSSVNFSSKVSNDPQSDIFADQSPNVKLLSVIRRSGNSRL
ncbi:uncharacterized protein LOC143909227 [Arctopsyche grandis]|uniref:uncharacterized protein LOC143909227 n=1 Tax=Arctopsyche grandis TaxID=121162 RepID=UPI00406D9AB0